MATYVNEGDSIECNKSMVASRKTTKPIYVKMVGLNAEEVSFFKYKTKIRAIVKITEELHPKECLICKTSNLLLNDTLEAGTIEIYTKSLVNFAVVSNFSHVHGIQGDVVNNFTYAKIVIPWTFVLQRQLA